MKHYCVLATAPGPGEGGGMSIYLQFMDALRQSLASGIHDETWHVFVDEGMPMPASPHVQFYQYHTKGFQRIRFDFVDFERILKQEGVRPDVIVSLQNTGVRCRCERSVIYYHQPLPLYRYNHCGFNRYACTYYFYHYLYPLYVKLFLFRNTFVAVQTHTVKRAFIKKFHFPENRMGVFFPTVAGVDAKDISAYHFEEGTYNFLFPANPSPYKEHITIAYAMKLIRDKHPEMAQKIRIHFTAMAGTMKNLEAYVSEHQIQNNFVFHGIVSHSQLVAMLNSSHGLLFPSMIETLGLPLLEAASLGIPVLVNHLDYAHEVLNGYQGANYIQTHDYDAWANGIVSLCGVPHRYAAFSMPDDCSWNRFLRLIREGSRK